MSRRLLSFALAGALALPSIAFAEDAMVVPVKRLTADTALKIAQGAIAECRTKGIQIGVTVVDRDGTVQAVIRDTIAENRADQGLASRRCPRQSWRTSRGFGSKGFLQQKLPRCLA